MIGFRAGPELVEPLDQAASDKNAPRSEIIRQAVVEWLKAKGYVKE